METFRFRISLSVFMSTKIIKGIILWERRVRMKLFLSNLLSPARWWVPLTRGAWERSCFFLKCYFLRVDGSHSQLSTSLSHIFLAPAWLTQNFWYLTLHIFIYLPYCHTNSSNFFDHARYMYFYQGDFRLRTLISTPSWSFVLYIYIFLSVLVFIN